MKTRISAPYLIVPVVVAFIVSSCSSEDASNGGDTAGIGGSGFISSGSVTGFGSVFVNGVEFETDSTVFDVEDKSGSQSDLRVGMVVQVEGTINSDGVTGTATGIQYSDEIEGPVGNIVENTDRTEKTFSILGTTVVVSIADTAYENLTYGSIAENSVIEVSGFYDGDGVLRASYVELKAATFDASSKVEIKGVISNLSGTRFIIQNLNVNAISANLSDLTDGLQNNVLVEVKGTYDSGSNTIMATEVEAEENALSEDADEVELEGYITRFASNSDFDINGFKVNASSAIFTPSALEFQLAKGDKIEAEGTMLNGVLIAMEIEVRGGNAELSAKVDSINLQNKSFTLAMVSGQPSVTVQLTTATRMEDDLEGSDDNFLLSELVVNNFVSVQGFESAASTITATRVKRESEVKEVELQGLVETPILNNSITVLGVTFLVDGTTKYENATDVEINQATFISTVASGTVVSITDKIAPDGNPVGTADEVEIED